MISLYAMWDLALVQYWPFGLARQW